MSLTKEGIGEPVPLAAVVPDQPLSVHTRGEAEGRPEDAHQDVAQADIHQDEVNGCPEGAKLHEDEENEEVADDPCH